MSIVSFESRDEKNISHAIANFLTAYGIMRLLRNYLVQNYFIPQDW